MVPTEYCSIKRSILLFILVIMAKIKIRKGEMHLKAMAKNMSTNAESNFTTDIAMQPIRNDQSFKQEIENITPITAGTSTGKNATINRNH